MADYVRRHTEISNVLISGGDAFLNSNEVIIKYLETFMAIPNISFIRFGTRTPVTFPFRITEDDGELTSILSDFALKKHIIVVTQFNHPREITEESVKSIRMLLVAGCSVFNQTVLLKGINDNPEILSALLNELVAIGVKPYYVSNAAPLKVLRINFRFLLSWCLRLWIKRNP